MELKHSFLSLWLFWPAWAAQPSAPSPVAAPLRELPWGQLNFLHTTDTHGWHAGHLQEPSYSADWGDYISFAQRLRERADQDGTDLLLIDTGDRIEGNGLFDSSDPKGKYTYDIFREQYIDVIAVGNHELYKQNSSDNEYLQTVPNFKGNYLSSNVDVLEPKSGERVALAPRYKKFTTKNQGIRIIAFAFLYDFERPNDHSFVQHVADAIKEKWFQDAIRDREVDLFLVSGHAAARSEGFEMIFKEIRAVQWDAPIQFFGGHYHIRDYTKYDDRAYALASGRYLETVGFQSISGLSTSAKKMRNQIASQTFARRYIDNNLYSFYHHTSLNETTFPTEHGLNVSKQIEEARADLGLDKRFGCAPKDLWTNRVPYPHEASVFSWLEKEVFPIAVVDEERSGIPRIVIGNTGAIRFDIFKGAFTRDTTYIISPFTSGFRYVKDVPYGIADKLLQVLNSGGQILEHKPWLMAAPERIGLRMQETVNFVNVPQPVSGQQILVEDEDLIPGYTTKDDAGIEGDDTVHAPIRFYDVPNCFEARVNTTVSMNGKAGSVEKVDLVYLEFIEPWVLLASGFLGLQYAVEDTAPYAADKDLTTMIAGWIQDNWTDDC